MQIRGASTESLLYCKYLHVVNKVVTNHTLNIALHFLHRTKLCIFLNSFHLLTWYNS